MKRRSEFAVTVVNKPKLGERGSIHVARDPDTLVLTFVLAQGDVLIGTCESAKRLGDWALENGVHPVRHGYDLRLADEEA